MRYTRTALATATALLALTSLATTAHANSDGKDKDGKSNICYIHVEGNHNHNACGSIKYGNNATTGSGHNVRGLSDYPYQWNMCAGIQNLDTTGNLTMENFEWTSDINDANSALANVTPGFISNNRNDPDDGGSLGNGQSAGACISAIEPPRFTLSATIHDARNNRDTRVSFSLLHPGQNVYNQPPTLAIVGGRPYTFVTSTSTANNTPAGTFGLQNPPV
ncbi:hypothetical protein [Streptomyces sp. NBC_01264]|uniref:hypothetical protein n=1 Tax=Streptomyces sp. NBC_01264 TaxID=2903804 RepID=UPI0022526806|nr:hypothetical protein [Streptomyces sp. NBC_01264]MCX4784610.1 hypothetical protein [Streptomyces sp. NBC_01264]